MTTKLKDPAQVRHVMQQRTKDCIIATAAMVGHVPYERAAELSPVQSEARGMFAPEILQMLRAVTETPWSGPWFAWLCPVGRLARRPYPIVAIIRRPWHWWTLHGVVLGNGRIYDPEHPRPFEPFDYDRRHWRVTGYYVPRDPAALAAVRQRRCAAETDKRLGGILDCLRMGSLPE